MAELAPLLASARLVTLTGAAGSGKTRLALRMVPEVAGRYPDGAHWIELAPLADAALLAQTIAKRLHVKENPARPALETLLDALGDKQLLLVLDNCEHLLSGCNELAAALLAETQINIMATSREPLSVAGEMLFPVPPLALPPRTLALDDVAAVSRFDAIQLFVERARALLPAFKLASDNAAVVAGICRRLDGIPLAIEMATARLNVLTAEQIASRLDDHFALLAPAAHVTYSPHETLRAAIDWSYDSLTDAEKLLFNRLSVFAGGCSLATAETVCSGEGIERGQVLDLLSSLVNKSLLTAVTLQRTEARYSFLESMRQFAIEKLIDAGERPTIRDSHLACFLQLAEETDPKLRGEYQQLWLNWLESEKDNFRAALSWSLESDQIEAGMRITIALFQFWTIRDYVEEGVTWLEILAAQTNEEVPLVVRSNALAYAATLAGRRGQIADQIKFAEESVALGEAEGEEGKKALAWALGAQAWSMHKTGDYQAAFNIGMRGIQLLREMDDPYMLGVTLSLFSFLAMSLAEYDVAHAMLDEALPLLREARDPYRLAMALNYSADLARCEQDYGRSLPLYEESITQLKEIDAMRDLASVYHNLGHAFLHLGEVDRAQALFEESLAIHQDQQNQPGATECLLGFAALAIVNDLPATGARLLSAAANLGGRNVTSEWPATRLEYEHYLVRARDSLTESEFLAEEAAGQHLSLEQAVTDAEEVVLKAAAVRRVRQELDDLTPREREVAILIAQAKSNEEIAAELVVSKRTVEKHIANIRSKLGFTQRAQIVRWAIESRLINSFE
jgi:non-specific serine/threonine protein kinase